MEQQYTNELSPEIIETISKSQQPVELPDNVDAEVRQQAESLQEFEFNHPVTAIYRIAVAGSLTRLGGVAREFSTDRDKGCKIHLENGQWASILAVGNIVTYPDGSSAQIISGAGQLNTLDDRGVALVGSKLNNGDEIISTPQHLALLCQYQGVPMPEDFLTTIAGA